MTRKIEAIIETSQLQITNCIMTIPTPHMHCLREQRGDLQPIRIFLSETSWLRFQICLQTKTLALKVNTMYGLHSLYHYFIYLQCVIFIVKITVNNTVCFSKYTLSLKHWQDIPRGELHPCTEAKRPENKVKNRYTTIFPCMH